ncbi:hypothetical protein BBP40_001537 [Aspergillus hancockii]|nr:hypothetical protein BBP40_001537 [Aspergillus hancockii]
MAHLDNLTNVKILELDVVSAASVVATVEFVLKDPGMLDVLVNNAGQSMGVIAVTHAFTPLVTAAKGTIVNVCSISRFLYAPWMGPYNASKAALLPRSETLRLGLQPFGVKVLSLVTGSAATNVMSHANIQFPADSLYQKATHQVQKRGVGENIQRKTSPNDFAKAVVKDVLNDATGPAWRGAMAWVVWFMPSFLPTSVLVYTGSLQLRVGRVSTNCLEDGRFLSLHTPTVP